MSPATRILGPYVRRQWKALAGAGGATGVVTLAELAKPWPLAIVIDYLLGRQAPFALESADWRLLAAVAALVLGIALAEAAATYFSDLLAADRPASASSTSCACAPTPTSRRSR